MLINGSIKRPYLGIFMQDLNLSPYSAQQLGLKVNQGVLVTRLMPGSPCDKAGLASMDIILKVDGHDVTSAKDVRDVLKTRHPGDVLDFVFYRKGGSGNERRKVTVGNYPDD